MVCSEWCGPNGLLLMVYCDPLFTRNDIPTSQCLICLIVFRWIIGSSLQFRFLVVAAADALLAFGSQQLRKMPVDVFPIGHPNLAQLGQAASPLALLLALGAAPAAAWPFGPAGFKARADATP